MSTLTVKFQAAVLRSSHRPLRSWSILASEPRKATSKLGREVMLRGRRLTASTNSLMPLRSSSRLKKAKRHTFLSARSWGASSMSLIRLGSGSLPYSRAFTRCGATARATSSPVSKGVTEEAHTRPQKAWLAKQGDGGGCGRLPVGRHAPAALAQPGHDVAGGGQHDVAQLQGGSLAVVDAEAHDVRRPRQLPLCAPVVAAVRVDGNPEARPELTQVRVGHQVLEHAAPLVHLQGTPPSPRSGQHHGMLARAQTNAAQLELACMTSQSYWCSMAQERTAWLKSS